MATGWRRLKRDQGSTLVEWALIFLVFISMILGIMDFGRALYAYHFVSHAAKSATRWASVNGYTCIDDSSCNGTGGMNNGAASDTDIQTYVSNLAPPGIDTTGTGCSGNPCLTTTVSHPVQSSGSVDPSPLVCSQAVGGVGPFDNYPGCTVEVQVSYKFNFIFPLVRTTPVTLSSSSEMIVVH